VGRSLPRAHCLSDGWSHQLGMEDGGEGGLQTEAVAFASYFAKLSVGRQMNSILPALM